MSRKTIVIALLLLLVPLLVIAQERVDLNVIHKIKVAELGGGGGMFGGGGGGGGRGASRVMDIMYNLTDRYGPRLTNSPQYRTAGEWAVGQLKEWGLSNVHLEKWATPENNKIPSWQVVSYNGAMVEPTYMSIIGVPVAWTAGTNGPVTGEAMLAQIQTQADMDKYRGKLKGKIILNSVNAAGALGPIDLPFPTNPLATRYTDTELADLVPEIFPGAGGGRGGPQPVRQRLIALTNAFVGSGAQTGTLSAPTATMRSAGNAAASAATPASVPGRSAFVPTKVGTTADKDGR
jgi:hypothetical protein